MAIDINFSHIFKALKKSVLNFGDYKIPKKSASLAYYTTFALAPIFYFILTAGSLIWTDEILNGQIFTKLQEFVGLEIADTLQGILSRTTLEGKSGLATVVSFVTLLVAATGVFVEMQDSINEIWEVEIKESSGVLSFLKDRLMSFSIIVGLGFLLLVSMLINSAIDVLHDSIQQNISQLSMLITGIINYTVLIALISTLFFLIFTVLPDVKFSLKTSITGALLTTILFLIGRYFIGLYLANSELNSVFGAGGTVVILLTWVYYTSMILYFGAAYTKNLALISKETVRSEKFANFIEKKTKVISDKAMNKDIEKES
ncbi:YihY/virulence factor BrkB family protein [Arcticibacterium luteifluviistationis]|uniref:Ribonuclease BN n=1 Tax=Arcticibacterium luteifluviistationis TaxID=1784714 RepID=A0A2Z4GGS9_9BACT|nr:YihY/virulence factor BrkB family protein [Arcticibacterium luteifluviistationis]AWW00392.1 ribonuclease BN [Arcticibacterium luteifluviistationis]